MTFTAEQFIQIILPVLGIIGTIAGAWAVAKRSVAIGERDQAKADADIKVKEADAKVIAVQSEAEAKIIAVQSQADQQKVISDLVTRQQTLLEKLNETTEARDAQTKEHYDTLRGVQNEMGRDLVKIEGKVEKSEERILAAIESLPARVQIISVETLKIFAEEVGAKLGMVIAQQLTLQRLDRDLLPFPDAEDPRWQTVTLKPRPGVKTATIQKQPFFSSETVLKKPCARIADTGEQVKIIRGHINHWYAIYKAGLLEDCWGWIEASKVEIVEAAVVPKPEPVR